MAHEDWNSIDNFTNDFDNVYCAFLDILGYKNKSEEYFQKEFNLFGRVERALESTKKIIDITSLFINLDELEVSFFSDSIIIVAPKNSGNLTSILHYSRVLSAQLSFESLFIRGGISEGKHLKTKTKIGSDFLASEALQKAYYLESKSAVNPRILVDQSILDFTKSELNELIVAENEDFILDFASIIINKDGNNEEDVYREMEDIDTYICNSNEDSVKSKYKWVLDYYYWTIMLNENFNIERFSKFNSGNSRGFKKIR